MVRTLVFLLAIFFCLSLANTSISAQSSFLSTPSSEVVKTNEDFDEAYKLYEEKLEEYRGVSEEYRVARAQYLKSKTQRSLSDAKEATIKLLRSRDDVIISYLEALKLKLQTTQGLNDVVLKQLVFRIDQEISWFTRHRDLVPSAGTLNDLVKDSQEASNEYTSTQKLIYEALGYISFGKVFSYKERLTDLFDRLKERIENAKKETDKNNFSSEKFLTLDRWAFEIENLLIRTEDKLSEAETYLKQISKAGAREKPSSLQSRALTLILEARQFLKEGNLYLTEIVREMKIVN